MELAFVQDCLIVSDLDRVLKNDETGNSRSFKKACEKLTGSSNIATETSMFPAGIRGRFGKLAQLPKPLSSRSVFPLRLTSTLMKKTKRSIPPTGCREDLRIVSLTTQRLSQRKTFKAIMAAFTRQQAVLASVSFCRAIRRTWERISMIYFVELAG
jgi:hypothetical protein